MPLNPIQHSLRYAERQRKFYNLGRFDNAKLPDGTLLPFDAPITASGDSYHVSMNSACPTSDMRYGVSQRNTGQENIHIGDWWIESDRSFTISPTKSPASSEQHETAKKDHIHLTIEERARINRDSAGTKQRAAIVTKEFVFPPHKDILVVDGTRNKVSLSRNTAHEGVKTLFQTDLSMPIIPESRRQDAKFLQARKQLALLQSSLSSARQANDKTKTTLFQNATQKLEEKIALEARKTYSSKTRVNSGKRGFLQRVLKNPQAVRQSMEKFKPNP